MQQCVKFFSWIFVVYIFISILGCGCDLPETVEYESSGSAIFNGETKILEGVFSNLADHRDDYLLTFRFDNSDTRFELHFDEIFLVDSTQVLNMRDTISFVNEPVSSFVQIFGCGDGALYELNVNDTIPDFIKFSEIDTIVGVYKGEFSLSLSYNPGSRGNDSPLYGQDLFVESGEFDLVLRE